MDVLFAFDTDRTSQSTNQQRCPGETTTDFTNTGLWIAHTHLDDELTMMCVFCPYDTRTTGDQALGLQKCWADPADLICQRADGYKFHCP
eukprot:COSAG06_NODE_6849_length_2747_cov_1.628021_2_plen_90_part_00